MLFLNSFYTSTSQLCNPSDFCAAFEHLQVLAPTIISLTEDHTLCGFACEQSQLLKNGSITMVNDVSLDDNESVDKALELLDEGLPLIYMHCPGDRLDSEFSPILSLFPNHRIGISITPKTLEEVDNIVSSTQRSVHGFYLRISADFFDTIALDDLISKLNIIVKEAANTVELYLEIPSDRLCRAVVTMIINANERIHLVIQPGLIARPSEDIPSYFSPYVSIPHGNDDMVDIYILTLRTDRADGLYTTLVCDEHRNCLGLVYSSPESIRLAFLKRRGIYYSRSRKEIWHKGESSGMMQTLKLIRHDCDRDAIQMIVHQHGNPPAFCHLNTRTCFGEDHGIKKLERTLQDRLKNAPDGSYTKRLYSDEKLLQQKLLEEVQEVIEAHDPEHIAAEAADVIYFLMVRCVAAGVTMEDIERNLDKKSLKINRRPGNAKQWRTRDAEKILKEPKPL